MDIAGEQREALRHGGEKALSSWGVGNKMKQVHKFPNWLFLRVNCGASSSVGGPGPE